MKKLSLIILISVLFVFSSIAQNLDTWSIGLGLNNTLLHGDLTSLNSKNNEPINIGFYVYVDKMFSPAFGFEFKAQLTKIKGTTQDFAPGTTNFTNGLLTESNAFGGELNAIVNLNGLSKNTIQNRKFNFSLYLGLGYHTYDSKLFDLLTNELITDFEIVSGRSNNAKSIYFTTALGLKYKLNNKIDLELRQSINFNNEDHLDALVHNKQAFESFFTTNLGLVYKLNKKGDNHIIWQDQIIEKNEKIEGISKKVIETVVNKPIEFIDTDKDGVIDQLDKEPNTPKGALAYGNGVAVDTDQDGVIDFYDKCPLKPGLKNNNGCPKVIERDSDGDNIIDKNDLCIHIFGPISNQGCPIKENVITEIEKTSIISLAQNIYFTSGKSNLRDSSKIELDKIASIMINRAEANFVIEGHTDRGGKQKYNLKLSQERANAVKDYLISKGVNNYQLKSIGYGFSIPKYTNRTSNGRQLNRRVEIRVDDGSIPYNSGVNNDVIDYKKHVIQANETIFSIAQKYNVTTFEIKSWNNLNNDTIVVGETLIIKK